jgi:hypothetical protein
MFTWLKNRLGITEEWTNQGHFQQFILGNTKELKLVLFLDELDNVLYSGQRDDFLTTFRALKSCTDQHNLKVHSSLLNLCAEAVVGLGVFSLIPMNTESSRVSPFNIKDALEIPFFSEEDAEKLIVEYSQEYSVSVSSDVVTALHQYTRGYQYD